MHGARAQLIISDQNEGGKGEVVGIFNNVSVALTFDVQPVYLLGRLSAYELVYTAQEPVTVTASGFRVIGAGPHKTGRVPNLQDLLKHEYISLSIIDRNAEQGAKPIHVIHSVRPTGYSTTVSARNLEEITVTFTGLLIDDESSENNESVGASTLP
jgi:hypothetical protein